MNSPYDIAVVGSGFAGSLIAMIARRLGHSVLLLEKHKHPRVVIGESSTPLSNLLLEDIADQYDLPQLKPLTKWGTWQQTYPDLPCGLKRGFSFVHQTLGADDPPSVDRQLLVAASPHDRIADTHWYRADFDEFFMHQARELGAEYVDELTLRTAVPHTGSWTIRGSKQGREASFRARFLIDATGPRGFLHHALGLSENPLPDYPAISALHSHFTGVDELAPNWQTGAMPYAFDSAAVHHIFDGGWIWVLRFNNGIASAGVGATQPVAQHFALAEGSSGWARLLNELPLVKEQFRNASSTIPFVFAPRLPFRSAEVSGPGWALLPSAAGFVDPLLSTGFPLTLLGVSRLAHILAHDWNTSQFETSLADYARKTDAELLATARLIAALYANMQDFATFRSLSLLYFAAASYSETARRLNKPHLASSFLLENDPVFGLESRLILKDALGLRTASERQDLRQRISQLVERFDVAGLTKPSTDHCYPVRSADLFAAAHKLGACEQDITTLLQCAGFND